MKLRLKNCLELTNTLSIHYSVVARTLKYTLNFGRIIGKIVAVVGRGILWFPCYILLPVSCFPVLRILYSKQLNTHWPVNINYLNFNPNNTLSLKGKLLQINICKNHSWNHLPCINMSKSLTIKLKAPMRERGYVLQM